MIFSQERHTQAAEQVGTPGLRSQGGSGPQPVSSLLSHTTLDGATVRGHCPSWEGPPTL